MYTYGTYVLYFDHYFWQSSWQNTIFYSTAFFSLVNRIIFKKNFQNGQVPFRFLKTRFGHTFFYKLKLSSSDKLRKMIFRKKYSTYGLGIAQPLGYSYSTDLLDSQRSAIDLTSRRKVRLRQTFFKWSTKGVGHRTSRSFWEDLKLFKLWNYSKSSKIKPFPKTTSGCPPKWTVPQNEL